LPLVFWLARVTLADEVWMRRSAADRQKMGQIDIDKISSHHPLKLCGTGGRSGWWWL
jgi:hypothetical protein